MIDHTAIHVAMRAIGSVACIAQISFCQGLVSSIAKSCCSPVLIAAQCEKRDRIGFSRHPRLEGLAKKKMSWATIN